MPRKQETKVRIKKESTQIHVGSNQRPQGYELGVAMCAILGEPSRTLPTCLLLILHLLILFSFAAAVLIK